MSTTSDLRAYADIAVEQGKQVLEQVQSQLTHVTDAATEQANELVARITGKSAPTFESLKSAAEPYMVQALEYGSVLSDKVEELLTTLKGDKRIGKFVENAEGLTSLAVVTVQDKVIKPVLLLAGQEGKPKASTATPSESAAETIAEATPASTTVPSGKAPATSRPNSVQAKATTKRAPAKKAAAKKAASPAKKAPTSKA